MINITTNAAQIAAKLDEITAALVSNTESCMTNACLAVQAKAMEKCPVNTGELRRSITTEVETNGTTVNGKVGTNVDYAPYERAESKLSKIGENLKRRKAIWKEMKKDSLFRNAKTLQAKNLVA